MPDRKWLRHKIPTWVEPGADWFVTLCCRHRGINSLANEAVHRAIIEALRLYESKGHLRVMCAVTMSDHVHIIARFDQARGIAGTIESLKRFLGRKHRIAWQDGFFDHRIRSDKLLRETIDYVRMNPVRAGLVKTADEWPYRWPTEGNRQGGLSETSMRRTRRVLPTQGDPTRGTQTIAEY